MSQYFKYVGVGLAMQDAIETLAVRHGVVEVVQW